MKIKTSQKLLSEALAKISRTISTKPTLPILSCLLLKAEKDEINLFATDLNFGIKTKIAGQIIKPGEIAIPAKIFFETIKTMLSEELELELEDLTLKIISAKSKTSLQCQSPTDFPQFPDFPELENSLSFEKLAIIDKYVSFSTSLDQARPILTALLFRQEKENIQIVGTDGFRLSVLKFKEKILSNDGDFLSTNKAFSEIVRLSQQSSEKVFFESSSELKQAFFKIDENLLFVRLVEGDYPPYEKIIPQDFSWSGRFLGEDFSNILNQALVFARESSNIITLKVSGKVLKVIAHASSKGSFEGEIAFKPEIENKEELEISFNAHYLQDLLKNIKPEEIWFGGSDRLKPALFKEVGNEKFIYVAMPFRLNG